MRGKLDSYLKIINFTLDSSGSHAYMPYTTLLPDTKHYNTEQPQYNIRPFIDPRRLLEYRIFSNLPQVISGKFYFCDFNLFHLK